MDWIKVECSTLTKPEVISIASSMKMERHHVIGCLLELWAYVQEVSHNGRVDAPVDACETLLCLPKGFMACLERVGWIKITPVGFSVPHFDYHMSEGAKARALKTLRQKRWRKNVDGHVDGDASTREEKKREDKKNNSPSSFGGRNGVHRPPGMMSPAEAFRRLPRRDEK